MKHIIFDCDSTVGLPGKPMDDVLALLYLLGNPDRCKVLGITCTFANGSAREVYASTKQFPEEIRRTDIPLLPGADRGEDPVSDAARFIADTVNSRPGEISLVAIGSLTNLYGAYLLDNTLFSKVREIVLMGGYTEPVLYHGKHLDEPCSALDVKSTQTIEALLLRLKETYTIVIVTHNLFQARRIADNCIFMLNGEIWEQNTTEELFHNPQRQETKDYLQGVYA